MDYFDTNPQGYITDAVEELKNRFEGLKINKSRVHEFMKDECNLSFKQATFWSEGRIKEETIAECSKWAKVYSDTDMDFTKNGVFIGESGFDINMEPSRAWAAKGKNAIVNRPKTRAVSHFIKKTLDIMDKYDEMKGAYLIMDNAPIHKSDDIKEEIQRRNRGYKCVYLPPYSPELNPIEQFWAIIKKIVRRHKLADTEMLEDRIEEACNMVHIEHLFNICQHSKKQFDNCLNGIPI
jgi:transposase